MESRFLKPAKIQHQKYPLSGLDLMFGFHYADTVHFLDKDFDTNALESALIETLNLIPVLAGKIVKNGNQLVLDTDGQGVQFTREGIDQDAFKLEDRELLLSSYELFNPVPSLTNTNITEMPLLTIKVTTFNDGIKIIGVRQSHVVMDGSALHLFMQTWASCLTKTAVKPFIFSRDAISDIAPANVELPSPESGISIVDNQLQPVAPKFFPAKLHSIEIPAMDFDRLREHIHAQRQGISINDFMQAMVFKAHGLSSTQDDGETAIANLCYDVRHAAGSKLALNFFGNAVLFRCLKLSFVELRSSELVALAQRIRQLMRPDAETVAQDIGFYQSQYENGNYNKSCVFSNFQSPLWSGGLYINSLLQIPREPIFDHQLRFDMVLPTSFGVRMAMLVPDLSPARNIVMHVTLEQNQIIPFEKSWSVLFQQALQGSVVAVE